VPVKEGPMEEERDSQEEVHVKEDPLVSKIKETHVHQTLANTRSSSEFFGINFFG